MAKTAYPEQKNGAVKKPAVAATTAAAGFDENKPEPAPAENKPAEPKETAGEKDKADPKNGLPFTVRDGFVAVVSKRRAGKSVIGSTGEVIAFDADGNAKVKIEDAMHFQKVPGFEFV